MRNRNRPLLALAGAMIVLIPVCVGGLLLDPRILGGQPIWAKPLKFSVSFVLYTVTLAWMISLVTGPRMRRPAERAGTVVAVAGAVEMVAILTQVVRGRASHFDVATGVDTAIWSVMGTTIVVLWLATALIGLALLRERTLPAPSAWAVRLGLAVVPARDGDRVPHDRPDRRADRRRAGDRADAGGRRAHGRGARRRARAARCWGGRPRGATCGSGTSSVSTPSRRSRCWPSA